MARQAVALSVLVLLTACTLTVSAEESRCQVCRSMVDKFGEGLRNTEKKGFEGGNTHWEETRLGQYATSETRLMEIHEGLCAEKDHDCFSVLESSEEHIEEWWKTREKPEVKDDLFEYICVDALKLCCPSGRYGKSCKPCTGGAERPCSRHGKCSGNGTRKGNGKCTCDEGYEGKACDTCKTGFYLHQSGIDSSVFACMPCHPACTACIGPGIEHCTGCKEGYTATDKQGCVDIDECATDNPCVVGEYCVNKPGSHECRDCDRSCARESGCRGGGSANCSACAAGYQAKADGACIDINECATEKCPVGQYCNNIPGSFGCVDCDPLCSSEGCHGPGSYNCESCKAGFRFHSTGHICQDIDECVESPPCEPGFSCTNTDGSYQCNCTAPKVLDNGKCLPARTEL